MTTGGSLATSAGEFDLLEAEVTLPISGVWTAHVSFDSATTIAGRVTLRLAGATFSGTVRDGRGFGGRGGAFVVGGAGGLDDEVPAKYYADTALRLPVTEILTDAGETLAPTADAAILDKHLEKWARAAGRRREALSALAHDAGASWRVLPNGMIWVGVNTWPPLELAAELIEEFPGEERAVFAPELATFEPGRTHGSRRIVRVTHRLTSASFRSEVVFQANAPSGVDALNRLIERKLERLIYFGRYMGKVVKTDPDFPWLIEVQPDDPRIPGLTKVPVRYPFPGMSIMVRDGARVLIGFEGGDPKKPFAELWESGGLEEVSIPVTGANPIVEGEIKLGDGTRRVLREGDSLVIPGVGTVVVTLPPGALPPAVSKLKA